MSKATASLIRRIGVYRAKGKSAYRTAEELFEKLRQKLPVGKEVVLEDGRRFVIEDKFAEKTSAFKTVGIDRYELKEIKG